MTIAGQRQKWHSGDRPVCCEKCFKDPVLRRMIREQGERGTCAWCGAAGVKVVRLEELGDGFREAARMYTTAPSFEEGAFLGDLFEEGWEIFGSAFEADSVGRNALVTAILTAGRNPKDDVDDPDYTGLFARRGRYSYKLDDHWAERMVELVGRSEPHGEGRPEGGEASSPEPPNSEVFALESVTERYRVPPRLYRARIHRDRGRRARFGPEDMGAPPPEKTRTGRANHPGQPVLYLASDARTAMAEVRPWRSAAVAIAKVRPREGLTVADLRKLRKLGSPFGIEDLDWLLQARALVRRFGIELATPVSPEERDLVYLPSLSICDAVRAAGFDGITYPSALAGGHNVVLFDPTAASAGEIEYVRVRHVRSGSEPLTSDEITPDAWEWSWAARALEKE